MRFFHPALVSESDASWDDALLTTVADVERDPSALTKAAETMFASLGDAFTTQDDGARGAVAIPSVELRDGVRIVRLNGYPSEPTTAYIQALRGALSVAPAENALVVDLRILGPTTLEQLFLMRSIWDHVDFAPHVFTTPLTMPLVATRYLMGFPPESGTTSGNYREGRETTTTQRILMPAPDARRVPVAFVVDRTAVVPDQALALERAGAAAIFSSDAQAGIVPGDARVVDAGQSLQMLMRTSAPIEVNTPRSGDLNAAIAWARNPSMELSPRPTVVPIDIAQRYSSPLLPDDPHRVLAIFRMWGTIAYASPYKSLMHDDWDAALATGIREVRAANSSLAYELALMKFYAHLHDSHGFIRGPAVLAAYAAMPAFLVREISGHSTIVRVDPVAARRDGFAVGDVVESIDGESVSARRQRMRVYINASTEQSLRDILDSDARAPTLFAGPLGSIATIRLQGADGKIREIRTPRVEQQPKLYVGTRPVVAVLSGNVGYVDLGRLALADVANAIQKIQKTRAIVFDLRGYPNATIWSLAPHFTSRTVRAALIRTPVRRTPLTASVLPFDDEYVDETRDLFTSVTPALPRLKQPIVVAIDARSISQAEYSAMYLSASGHARFAGEPTAGADGDVTRFLLPGGVTANFSGQAMLYPSGRQTQRVGIIPDIHVSPSVRGIRAGDDEVLIAALREALTLAHADAATKRSALAAERATERADARAQR